MIKKQHFFGRFWAKPIFKANEPIAISIKVKIEKHKSMKCLPEDVQQMNVPEGDVYAVEDLSDFKKIGISGQSKTQAEEEQNDRNRID